MTASRRGTFGLVFLTLVLDLLGFSIIFPVFAHLIDFYQSQNAGVLAWMLSGIQAVFQEASDDQVAALFGGILFGAYALLQFLMAPVWGALSDRIGRRPVLLISISGNLLSYILWIFAGDFVLVIIARLLAGAMSGNISTASAVIADVTDDSSRAAGMGMLGAAIGLGFIGGPALGGLCYTYLPRFGSEGELAFFALNPFSMLAACAALLSLINLLWIALRFSETRDPGRVAGDGRRVSIWNLADPSLGQQVIRLNILYLCYMILFAAMESTLVFLAKEILDYSPAGIARLFVMIGLIGIVIQGGLIRRLAPRFGERRLLCAGILLQLPGYVLLALLPLLEQEPLIWGGCALLAAGSACIMPSASALISRNASDAVQGRALGLFRAMGALGRCCGPLLGALCYFFIDQAAPYVCAAVLLLIPLFLAAGLRQPAHA